MMLESTSGIPTSWRFLSGVAVGYTDRASYGRNTQGFA
jgi:hypothetical protein